MKYWMPTCDYGACIVVKDTSNFPHGDRELMTACGSRVVAGWDEQVVVKYVWIDESDSDLCLDCVAEVFRSEKDKSCSS